MMILRDISLRRGGELLLDRVSATIQPRQSIALIGANGSGKSSFFKLLLRQLEPDSGTLDGLESLRIAHMAQDTAATDEAAARFVLGGDAELAGRLDALTEHEASGDYEAAAALHGELALRGGYDASARVARLLRGLGFESTDGERPVVEFSGGWRVRLQLARALMTPSDLLLLDEPTNHLDLDATLWLQDWLRSYPGTLLLISHDRDFIDACCDRVLHLDQRSLEAYSGGYSAFERQRAERALAREREVARVRQRRQEIESFVARFRAKATKARQAQSRLRELERLPELASLHADSPFRFRFPEPPPVTDPVVGFEHASLGYGSRTVLGPLSLRIAKGDRIGLLGRNGAGKSTLLRSLCGLQPLLGGERLVARGCRIGYFDQQQVDVLDLDATPAVLLMRLAPDASDQQRLDFLGRFGFSGEGAQRRVGLCSGGERARLALALIVWQAPNLLVLDEPTNHLDLDMRRALELALQEYEGAVLLVTHDRHLLRTTVDELWLLSDGAVGAYEGDLDDYARLLRSREAEPTEVRKEDSGSDRRRDQRREAARQRERERPLRRALEETERALAKAESALAALRERLADPGLYDVAGTEGLAELLREEGQLRQRVEVLEGTWLEQQASLEAISAGE